MKYKSLLVFLCFLFSTNFLFSQNKILMLNGKVKDAKQFELKGDWIFYKRADSEDKDRKFFLWKKIWPKDKLRKLDKFDVFSATKPDGTEVVFYDPDSLEGDPNATQVRNYIRGEQYGMAVYHKPLNKIEGGLVGAGSGLLSFYGPAAVFVNSLVLSRFNPRKIPYTNLIEPEVFSSPEFGTGYKKYARNRKIKDTLIFGTIGFAVGFAFFATVLK